jgi:hypothetical protein
MDNDKCITTDEIAKAFNVKPTCDNIPTKLNWNINEVVEILSVKVLQKSLTICDADICNMHIQCENHFNIKKQINSKTELCTTTRMHREFVRAKIRENEK